MTEEIKYIKCPDCRGRGELLFAEQDPGGYHEVWRPCEFCDGHGDFEEDDYLILKLEGKV